MVRAGVGELCKRCVEVDRCEAAREQGFAVGLFKVKGAEEMAKSDLLVGVPAGAFSGWSGSALLVQPSAQA